MFRGLLTPHADDSQIGVDAGPRNDTQSVRHPGQPPSRDRGERAEGESPAFDRFQAGIPSHPFESGARRFFDIDLAGRDGCEIGGKKRCRYGACGRPRNARTVPLPASLLQASNRVTPNYSHCEADGGYQFRSRSRICIQQPVWIRNSTGGIAPATRFSVQEPEIGEGAQRTCGASCGQRRSCLHVVDYRPRATEQGFGNGQDRGCPVRRLVR